MILRSAKGSSVLMAVIGASLVAGGFYYQASGSSVSSADQQRCEQIIQNIYGDNADAKSSLLPKCNEPGMVAMMDARAGGSGASEAAAAIASANQTDITSNALGYGVMGVGVALVISGLFGMARAKRNGEV